MNTSKIFMRLVKKAQWQEEHWADGKIVSGHGDGTSWVIGKIEMSEQERLALIDKIGGAGNYRQGATTVLDYTFRKGVNDQNVSAYAAGLSVVLVRNGMKVVVNRYEAFATIGTVPPFSGEKRRIKKGRKPRKDRQYQPIFS